MSKRKWLLKTSQSNVMEDSRRNTTRSLGDFTDWSWSDVACSFPVRLTFYGVIAFALFQGLYLGLNRWGSPFIGAENGPVEMTQVYLAIFTSACFFYAAYWCRVGRAGLIVCAAMVGYAAARESDSIFESMFFEDAYKYLVGLPMLLVALAALWVDRRKVIGEALWLVRQPAVTLFAIAGIYLCCMCQVLDRPDFWVEISSETEASNVKAMVEEFAEIFAYLALAFSGVEALAMAHGLDEVAQYQLDVSAEHLDADHTVGSPQQVIAKNRAA